MPIQNGQVVNWKNKIRIRHVYKKYQDEGIEITDEIAKEIGKKLYKILQPKKFMQDWDDLESLTDLDDASMLNECLETLFDYCDENLIWVEL